jgi:pSer/pThr/pTyr-binding forkhead associated (FHA) protein/tetratricopeptide (TPR) repeat protein
VKLTVLKSNKPFLEQSWTDDEIGDGFEVFVGRSEDCHVLIDDPLISRHQVVIRNENNKWMIEKLSELGLITIHGEMLESVKEVNNGDIVSFPPYAMIITQLKNQSHAFQTPSYSGSDNTEIDPALLNQTGLMDDIPEVESLDATEVMASDSLEVLNAELPSDMSERTQELAEEILSDQISPSEENTPEDFGSSEMNDHFNDNSDESAAITDPLEENNFDSDSIEPDQGDSEVAEFGAFGDADSTQADMSGGIDDGDDGSTRVFQSFASYELLIFGEFAPYDRYAVDKSEIFIGRDPKKCQIVLNDSEVSSVHAVLRKSFVNMTLEDLNSSNGTLLNGQRINKTELNNNDEFIIGSTTFTVQVVSDLLESEGDRLMPVEEGQVIERIEEIEEEIPLDGLDGGDGIDFNSSDEVQEKSALKRIWKDPKKRKKLIFGIVGLILLMTLLDEEPTKAPKPPEAENKEAQVKPDENPEQKVDPNKRQLSPDEIRALEAKYKIAESYVNDKKLDEALAELEQILSVDPDYANAKILYSYVEKQNRLLKEEQERLKLEAAKAVIREEVKAMVVEAKEAAADRNVPRAEQLFAKILEKDPENMDVAPLKEELQRWQAQERAKAEAIAKAKADRQNMVDALAPGKKLFLAQEWHKASLKLREFTGKKGMDEDLLKEAASMIAEADSQLAADVAPLLGKARSLKEGQDLKAAYETYLEVLVIDPTSKEALDEVDGIKGLLDMRSKRVYREAIISESLSLFGDAKEKFQEVQQISPTDSEYYKKATEKLKNYLE